MHFDHSNEEELEKLRMENELKKMKLMLERGAVFPEKESGPVTDPVIENMFLKHIEAFEQGIQDAERISVFDFIGKPSWKSVDYFTEEQIGGELDKILTILTENGISLTTICDVDEHTLYQFITEELFLQEIDNMRIPGMMTSFIYEEFHPNHEHDIRETCIDGIRFFMGKESQFYTYAFSRGAIHEPWFTDFSQAYSSFELHSFYIGEIRIDGDSANAGFAIDFTGTIEGTSTTQKFAGEGFIALSLEYECWQIEQIHFPEAV